MILFFLVGDFLKLPHPMWVHWEGAGAYLSSIGHSILKNIKPTCENPPRIILCEGIPFFTSCSIMALTVQK